MNFTIVDAVTRNKITPLHIAVVTEQNEVVQELIKHGANIDEQTASGLAAIHLALLYKSYKVFNTLVECGADLEARSHDGSSLLHFAIENNKFDVIESLVEKGVEINAKNIITGETPLHTATRNGLLEIIKILVQHGADVNAKNRVMETPLHYVTLLRPAYSRAILDILIRHNAQVDLKDDSGRTALHHAVVPLGDILMVSDLISNGANVNAEDYLGRTPLHLCAENDTYLNTIEFLLTEGAYVDPTDFAGQSPLHIAVKHGQMEVVRRLMSRGASITRVDRNSQTPVHLTAVHDRGAIFELMWSMSSNAVRKTMGTTDDSYPILNSPQHLAIALGRLNLFSKMTRLVGDRGNLQTKSLFDTAAASGNLDMVNSLASLIDRPQNLLSSLCLAARYGYSDIVDEFLTDFHYYSVNEKSTAICCAQQHKKVVELLISKNVDVNVNCTNGLSPLQNAARTGNTDVVKILIKHFFGVSDWGNQKLLQVMVENGRLDVAKGLIDRGADLNEEDVGGITLLHIVSQSGHISDVKRLVDSGISVDVTTQLGETPLHFAAKGGNVDIIEYLVSKNASNAMDHKGWTPIYWALDSKAVDLSVVKSLVSYGWSVSHICSRGKTALHIAVGGRAPLDVIRYLLSKDPDVNARDLEGNTPLFDAVRRGSLEIVKLLVEAGANATILNNLGLSPLHYLASIPNGGIPISDEPSNEFFQRINLRAMDICHYLKTEGVMKPVF